MRTLLALAATALIVSTHAAEPTAETPAPAQRSSAPSLLIDLPTALRLAGSSNLDLALIREAQRQAEVANTAATLNFLPWIAVGAGYAKHTGAGQDFPGDVVDVDKQLYDRAVSINAQVTLGDAIYQKLAARQLQSAASYGSEAARADTLLAAADGYFALVAAAAQVDIAAEAVRIAQDYEAQLGRAADIGLTNRSDVLRGSVQSQAALVLQRQSEAAVQTAANGLRTLLRLDPGTQLAPAQRMVEPLTLVPMEQSQQALLDQALAERPELKGGAAAVAAAESADRGARYGPLIPTLSAQAIYGQQRGGPNDLLTGYLGSHDYIIGLNWRLGPGGLLDFTRSAQADSQLRQSQLREQKLRDSIVQQVADAYQSVHAAFDQIGLTRRSVALAEQSLALSQQRREFGVAAILEVIQAQRDLTQARTDYVQSLAQYARAQYALAHATARLGG